MSDYIISGIQQIGLGNDSVYDTWEWYRKHLGFDLPIFDEAAEANLMLPYTGGEPKSRHAVLAMNYGGGGGLEIWQHTTRVPQAPKTPIQLGDLGIQIIKYKALDVHKAYSVMKASGVKLLSEVRSNSAMLKSFYAEDLNGNWLEITEGIDWNKKGVSNIGGIVGCTIGVSDIEASLPFYQEILGYDKVLTDSTKNDQILHNIATPGVEYRRVRLTHSQARKGPFSKLLGSTYIELIQAINYTPKKIFQNRMWGDLGYIHLCFDVRNMSALQTKCTEMGHPFTVDSADSFDMGEAAGRFAYVEDPDGTLIEFVEAHKIPLIKKMGWYLDLTKRNPEKSLPGFMLWAMSLGRVKGKVN